MTRWFFQPYGFLLLIIIGIQSAVACDRIFDDGFELRPASCLATTTLLRETDLNGVERPVIAGDEAGFSVKLRDCAGEEINYPRDEDLVSVQLIPSGSTCDADPAKCPTDTAVDLVWNTCSPDAISPLTLKFTSNLSTIPGGFRDWDLVFTVNGETGSLATPSITPGPTFGPNLKIVVPGTDTTPTSFTAGNRAYFYIQTRDAFGFNSEGNKRWASHPGTLSICIRTEAQAATPCVSQSALRGGGGGAAGMVQVVCRSTLPLSGISSTEASPHILNAKCSHVSGSGSYSVEFTPQVAGTFRFLPIADSPTADSSPYAAEDIPVTVGNVDKTESTVDMNLESNNIAKS